MTIANRNADVIVHGVFEQSLAWLPEINLLIQGGHLVTELSLLTSN